MNWKLLGGILAGFVIISIIIVVMLRVQENTLSSNYSAVSAMDTVTEISVLHSYSNGRHTYQGSIPAPTPCHDLVRNIDVKKTVPENIQIDFEMREGSEQCVQMVSKIPFEVFVEAEANAVVSITLNSFSLQVDIEEIQTEIKEEENIVDEEIEEATSSTTESQVLEEV